MSFWTEKELKILKEGAGVYSWQEIADELGRSYQSVAVKAHFLGLKGRPRGAYYGQGFKLGTLNTAYKNGSHTNNNRPSRSLGLNGCSHQTDECEHRWTREMDQIVRDGIENKVTFEDLGLTLNKTTRAVSFRSRLLGLRVSNSRSWTQEEDLFVADNFLSMSQKELSYKIDRSWQAVAQRAIKLGVARSTLKAENSPMWRGGRESNYGFLWHREIRPATLLRDNYLCQYPKCSVYAPSGNGKLLHVHHIVPRPLTKDDRLCNLITLCHEHHYMQEAHKWLDVTPELLDTLPSYQKQILRSLNGGTHNFMEPVYHYHEAFREAVREGLEGN